MPSSPCGSARTCSRGSSSRCSARVEHAEVARAVTRSAYRAGARYVDVLYSDQHLRRALIEGAPDDVLSWTPPWLLERAKEIGDERAAVVALTGDAEPDLLADLPGERVGRARMLELAEENNRQVNEQLNNWTVIGVPNAGWAQQMFGEPDVERLWQLVEFCVRLDEDDPVAAWQAHVARIGRRARLLDDMKLDAVRFTGPGTDLTVGLLPESRWQGVESLTADGVPYVANMPTEEVFTTPDARRTEGYVRSTRPLALYGRIVRGLEVRFENGRIVDVRSDEGSDVIEGQLATDERAAYLGEVALVDGTSRIGRDERDLLRDALRRERDLPRRLRQRLHRGGRGRAGRGRERLDRAHRLHGRRARDRRRRRAARRHRGAAPARRRLAARALNRERGSAD